MDDYEIRIADWLNENGVVDSVVAKVIYSALDLPGDYGPYYVAYDGHGIILSGPASRVMLDGSNDIQAMRMRLDEIIVNG